MKSYALAVTFCFIIIVSYFSIYQAIYTNKNESFNTDQNLEYFYDHSRNFSIKIPSDWIPDTAYPSPKWFNGMPAVKPVDEASFENEFSMSLYTKENTAKPENTTWPELYKIMYLQNKKYSERDNKIADYESKTLLFEKHLNNNFQRECTLFYNVERMYSFCYSHQNSVHQKMLDSLILNF